MNRILRYLLLLLLPLGGMADVADVSSTAYASLNTANLIIRDAQAQEALTGQAVGALLTEANRGIYTDTGAENSGATPAALKGENALGQLQHEAIINQEVNYTAAQAVSHIADRQGQIRQHENNLLQQQQDEALLAQTTDPALRQILEQRLSERSVEIAANQNAYEYWKEGGTGRNLLHGLSGALTGGTVQSAAAGYASSAASPLLNRLNNPVLDIAAGAGIGALAGQGNVTAIAAGANTDWNNRLPHKRAYDQLNEAQKERYNYYIENGILPYEVYQEAYDQCADSACRETVEESWREADRKMAELDKQGIADGRLSYKRHFNDPPHEDFQANTLKGFEQNSSLDSREVASWAGYFGGGTSEQDIAQYAQNHALRSGGMSEEQAYNYQWWGNVHSATLLPNDIRFGQGAFAYSRATVTNNLKTREPESKTEANNKQPNFIFNGESYRTPSATAQPDTTVRLSQAQRLSDGRQLPIGTLVTTSGNAMKATLPDGTVIRGNTEKLLQPQLQLTYNPTTFVLKENRAIKIFGTREGHIPDTPNNRQMLLEVANDPRSVRGIDTHNNTWHEKNLPDGSQIWIQTRDGQIWNGGINNPPKIYNPETGFSAPNKPKQK